MTLTLRPITKDNWQPVYLLTETLSDEQRSFVSDNGFSILEAIYDAEKFSARAIYMDETPVGFLMTDYDESDGRHWIVRLMIGADYQRKGYGREALNLVLDEFKALPNCEAVYIGFNPNNQVARQLYESFGFVDTGKIEYEEMIFCLPLTAKQVS